MMAPLCGEFLFLCTGFNQYSVFLMLFLFHWICRSKTQKVKQAAFLNQTKQDRMQIFKGILFFKATNNTVCFCIVCGFEEEDSLKKLCSVLFCLIKKRSV